ncbi:MAG TPA: ABC transporter permease [Solirubrobacterales bacterium]|nr:ABC transporter permease [Solirubrobacterales bacterium]
MPAAILNSADMTRRAVIALLRQPWYVAVTLVQPVIWLLLFGALFESVSEIPGFEESSYQSYIAPGIVVMTALFSSGWSGMGMINDFDRGVMDRFLVTPVRRSSLIIGPLAQTALSVAIQAVIIVALAIAVGADFDGGVPGVAVLIVVGCLLAASMGALSNAIALTTRQEETLIGLVQFVVLPLTFLSAAFMQLDLMPGWMAEAAQFNPVNWAVEAGREAVGPSADWGLVAERVGLLFGLALLCVWVATRAFRSYQRSV